MKVLVIGSGAREHAIAHALMRGDSVSEVTVAPGNPGMELDGIRTTQLNPSNHAALIDFVKNNGYDWVFVGPEVPLIEGIVDDFAAAGIKAFGPNKAAAQIEGSKDFAKQLMERHDIPTAKYQTFDDLERSTAYVREHGAPIVIKADGLAAGKGVTVAMDEETAIAALEDIFVDHRFGNAGAKVVIEDFLEGQEFSLMSFVNGTDFWPMPISQDHKRAYDGDKGPNTGGMGAYSPVPQIGQDVIDTAIETIVKPTVQAMADEGTPFTGILYAGLIATADGGLPNEMGLIKNQYVARTFIQPTQELREQGVRMKLSAVRGVVKGKRVIVIDDSIVRGTTSKRIVQLLKEAGAAEVHMRISSPPLKYPCFYGIDISTTKELIAAKKSVEEIREYIGADSLAFLSLDGLVESIGLGADAPYGGLCVAYFNGDYPTALDDYEADFLKSLTPEDRVRLPEFALYKSKYEGNEYTTTSPQEEH